MVGIGKHGVVTEHVFFALGFLPLMLGLRTWPTRALVNPVTWFLGRISYSAYILHFAVLEVVRDYFDAFVKPERGKGVLAFALLFAVTLLVTVPLAWLAYRYIERPCIDLGAALIRRRRAAVGATATPAKAAVAAIRH